MFDAWLGMVWTRSLSRAGRPCAFALVTATLLVLPSLVVAQQGATAADSAGGQECRQQGARVSVTRLRGGYMIARLTAMQSGQPPIQLTINVQEQGDSLSGTVSGMPLSGVS